jgi:AraC family transcriptional regulator
MQPTVSVIDTSLVVRRCALNNRADPVGPIGETTTTLNQTTTRTEEASGTVAQLHRAVAELFNAVADALQGENESAHECLARAGALLRIAVPSRKTQVARPGRAEPSTRGGLAPWQIREVTTHIEANLEATITVKQLAALVRLSSYHFCRAFRISFGDSPHGYLMRRRVERAQGLMLTSNVPLGQIAAACGLADQAHFNKLFRRFVGENPGAWRRARASAPRDTGGALRVAVPPHRPPTLVLSP